MRNFEMQTRKIVALAMAVWVMTSAASVSFGQSKKLTFKEGFKIECKRKIDVPAQADGKITEMMVEEGSVVPSKALMFKIDSRTAESQLQVSQKELESAQEQAKQDAEERFAEAALKVAKAEYDNEVNMLEKGATTSSSLRRKKLEYDKAFLQVGVAKVKRITDKLAVGVAEAKRDAAKVQLGLYEVDAPWDAFVYDRLKHEGAWIKAGEPVLKISNMADMKIMGLVELNQLKKEGIPVFSLEGALLQAVVEITPTEKLNINAQISFVSSMIDDTQTIRITANIENQRRGNTWLLRDGMRATEVVIQPR
jgi:multidrug resistance efflux pump